MEQKELLYVSPLVSQCWTQSVISYTFITGVDVMVLCVCDFFELFFEGGMIVHTESGAYVQPQIETTSVF